MFEMMFSLTSGHSSFNWVKNNGSRSWIVLSLPTMGDRPMTTDARADLTWGLGSTASSVIWGMMPVIMTCSRLSWGKFSAKSLIFEATAALTSASVSFSKPWWRKNVKKKYLQNIFFEKFNIEIITFASMLTQFLLNKPW